MHSDSLAALRSAINRAYLIDEQHAAADLLIRLTAYDPVAVDNFARPLVAAVRSHKFRQSLVAALLHEYQLNTREGIVLMEIAEALLRIPDTPTQDALLREKLTAVDWGEHRPHSDSVLVHLLTRALAAGGRIEALGKQPDEIFVQFIQRLGAPLIRVTMKQAMQRLAGQFVIAESIEAALQQRRQDASYRYSFDMLGEAALTASDAERYFRAYSEAITVLAKHSRHNDCHANPGISVKLSALCPRYEPLQQRRALAELTPKLLSLAKQARDANISVTVDAEESERLALSLTIFAAVFCDPALHGWPGLGLAVQAYQKRAPAVIQWLAALSEEQQRQIPLRLVKGAYWDSEIKRAQENGLSHYPVFTHKTATDVSFLACAQAMLAKPEAFYPQFATHNAHTVAAVRQLGAGHPGFEFQRLYGMGEQLYAQLAQNPDWRIPCRIYAPVGYFGDLLPYLVRRLLENGANTSFINRVENPEIDIDEVVADPVALLREMLGASHTVNLGTLKPSPEGEGWVRGNQEKGLFKSPHPGLLPEGEGAYQTIVLPVDLYRPQRANSTGLNLSDAELLEQLQHDLDALSIRTWQAYPLINGRALLGEERLIVDPSDRRVTVGTVVLADPLIIDSAVESAANAFDAWRLRSAAARSAYLLKAADLLEDHRLELMSLCIREGGRTIRDALSEVREAVDYCRYYAATAEALFNEPQKLPGPTGEENRLYHYGRGVFVCISPWNFPLAIFIGQIVAALAAGNTVIAKPATQTPLTAMRCVQILHRAGIPKTVLHLLPCDGATIGRHLLTDPRIAGVALTGSTDTARFINRQLAQHLPAIVPLIAETGGQNVLIADSSAYAEQLVGDAVQSAFNSAGQRCSALRVLFVQQECADKIIAMLTGAMQQLHLGNPGHYATDIGPVIGEQAAGQLAEHVDNMRMQAKVLYQLPLPEALQDGSFFPPTLIELTSLAQLQQEVFGPVLHIIRFRSSELAKVIDAVNATGYGLTLGIHSRIDAHIRTIRENVKAGNIYVNRNMIGAVVGVQPFGGMGFSGTGPKAGGPEYLLRFAVEQTVATNTAAVGGNAALLMQDLR